jgi:hypothetical protein
MFITNLALFYKMARIKKKPKEAHLELLRKELSKKQTYNILTSTDCKLLSDNMENIVSSDTLRRLFNVIKNNNTISLKSLNHCAVYCGFNDWGSFIDYYNQFRVNENKIMLLKCLQGKLDNQTIIEKIDGFPVSKEVYDLFIQIILMKVIQKDKDFFIKIFDFETLFVDVERNRYEIYYIIHLLSTLCQSHKWLQEIAIEHYFNLDSEIHFDFESDFFIEWLVTPQFEFYRTLLHNYHNVKKNNLKANAFYHLVIADYYADIEDWINFNLHYGEIKKIDFKDIEHNILSMRLKGIELIYAFKFNPNEFDKLCFEIDKINFWYIYNDLGNRITSLLFICISLHKCEQYRIITNIIKKSFGKYGLITTQWGEQNWNHLKIIYADCLLKSNEKDKAKEIFNTISNSLFDLNFSPFTDKIYEELKLNI